MAQEFFRFSSSKSVNLIEMMLPELIDTQEFDRINESMLSMIRGKTGGQWVIDLTKVQYMGSAMLGLMINLRQQIRSGGGKLVLCCLSAKLVDIFHTCSLERLFTIAKTQAEGLKILGVK